MAPLPYESTASWLGRVAATYRQSVPELLDGIGITTTGARGADDTDTTEIHLDDAARHRLAVFARVPHHHLARALPHLERPRTRTRPEHRTPSGQPGRAAPRGIAPTRTNNLGVLGASPAPHRRRHRTRTDVPACPSGVVLAAFVLEHLGGRSPCSWTPACPNSPTTHREQLRLLRRPNANTAYTWAQAIVTRWYDHRLYLTGRWKARGRRLAAFNPDHTTTQGSSWELTARPVIVHPETVVLARVLARTRLPATPRPDRHPAVTTFLEHTAHTLGLARLAPGPDDLLRSWIRHHTRP
ncbi:hypothetical protein [Embleya sp. NBC_00896]|uniref:hypothetical protein n=1 Tax=Embleya sp. NBC_00896 TaxID=2975961 RepID=UPI002F90E47F|nr:hypothetical protein OG928_47135 [Embleya sp. NBC_00896]